MNLSQFKERLFEEGEKQGFSELELYYEKNNSLIIALYEGDVDEYNSEEVQGASVRGRYKGKTGYAYTEKLDEDSIQFLLKNAKENAELIENEPEEFFTEQATYEEAEFYSPDIEKVSPEEMIELLKDVEKKIFAQDSRVTKIDALGVRKVMMEKGIFHNEGLTLNERNNFLMIMVSVLVQENDELKSGMDFKVTKDFKTLDADDVAKEVVENALSYLGEQRYPNKNYPVVLKNTAAASLLSTFASSFSAQAVQDNQSRLKDKLSETIAATQVTLIDDPFLKDGVLSSTFDSEGVPTSKHTIVDAGKLQTYFHNLKTVKKDGVASTGHARRESYKDAIEVGPSNFYVEPAKMSYEEQYVDLEEGIIITGLAGLHSGANQISGDFSLAADGYYVENGEIVGPTKQMTVAGNFFDLLKDVEKVGNDLEFTPMSFHGYVGSPSLKIKSLAIAVD